MQHRTRQLASVNIDVKKMTRVPHPPFSPDLAPSDFYLFGRLKTTMKGCLFEDEKELLEGIISELNKISREEPETVFQEWVLRLDRYTDTGGEYVD
jgi:hypothetical protein